MIIFITQYFSQLLSYYNEAKKYVLKIIIKISVTYTNFNTLIHFILFYFFNFISPITETMNNKC